MVGSTAQPRVSGPIPATSAFAERSVQIPGGVLGYRECGAGVETIVLLHGISSGSGSWSDCALALGRRARVIAWDAPGYGLSTALGKPRPSASDYALSVQSLLEALEVERCLLVGHSLGALMASAYGGLADPEQRVAGFVLMSPALGYQGARSAHADQVRNKRLAALKELGIEGMANNLPERLLTKQADDKARQVVRANALRLRPQGYMQAVELLCGDDIDRYALPKGRSWVFCGEHDIVTPPEQSAEYAERHGLPFALIPAAGHACYVERPNEVAEILIDALTLLDASGKTI